MVAINKEITPGCGQRCWTAGTNIFLNQSKKLAAPSTQSLTHHTVHLQDHLSPRGVEVFPLEQNVWW